MEAGAELSNFRQICSLQHANIVQILGATFLRGHPFILEEDSPGGDMQSLITGRSPTTMKLDGAAAIKLTEGIIRGLEFLHSRTPQARAAETKQTRERKPPEAGGSASPAFLASLVVFALLPLSECFRQQASVRARVASCFCRVFLRGPLPPNARLHRPVIFRRSSRTSRPRRYSCRKTARRK